MKAIVRSFAIGAIAAGLLACTDQQRVVERNVRLFEELAFGGSFDNDLPEGQALVKWDGPIQVLSRGEGVDKFRSRLRRQLQRVSQLTGLSVHYEVARTATPNYVVVFSEKVGFSIRKDFVRCAVNVKHEDGVIQSAQLHISTADEAAVDRCIAHEIMHSFGFRFHSGVVKSILSPAHGERNFTPWDELMLKTLYDRRLAPGMTRHESIGVVRQLIGTALTE